METSVVMQATEEKRLYLEGIRLFNAHEFFEAHEIWEEIWRVSTGVKREFYQGLIQCAVALEHLHRGNPRGVRSLNKTYRRHFSLVPDIYMGINLPEFIRGMQEMLRPILEVDGAQPSQIAADFSATPRILLTLWICRPNWRILKGLSASRPLSVARIAHTRPAPCR